MSNLQLIQHRLVNQQLIEPSFAKPSELVAWFGAVQAQDYAAAKWAIGLRLPDATDAAVEQAIADKSIVRTWALRGTLHLVATDDLRWMLALVRHRLDSVIRTNCRKLELTEEVFAKSQAVMIRMLEGGQQLTRSELKTALTQAGILTHDLRMNFLLNKAAFDGLICCGSRREKEFTFTLLDEWSPGGKHLGRDEALSNLIIRYFQSHGPATLSDFVWWAGLSITEAREGLELAKSRLSSDVINGQTYWQVSPIPVFKTKPPTVHLLPSFDEYLVAYKDRSAALGPLNFTQIVSAGNGIFSPVIVVDGQVVGTWKRVVKKDTITIDTHLFFTLSEEQQQAISLVSNQYHDFLEIYIKGI